MPARSLNPSQLPELAAPKGNGLIGRFQAAEAAGLSVPGALLPGDHGACKIFVMDNACQRDAQNMQDDQEERDVRQHGVYLADEALMLLPPIMFPVRARCNSGSRRSRPAP